MRKPRQRIILSATILFACLLATRGWAQQDTRAALQSERARAVDKIKEVNRWGPEARIVSDFARNLDEVIQAGVNADILIGWGLTRDGQAYRFHWTNNRFSFDKLSPEEAGRQNFAEMSMTVKRLATPGAVAKPQVETLTQQEALARGHRYYISDAVVGEPAGTLRLGQPIRGRVRLVRGPQTSGDVVLELQWTSASPGLNMYDYPKVPPGQDAKEVTFEFPPLKEEDVPKDQKEVSAVLRVVAPPRTSGAVMLGKLPEPLSNGLAVSFRVVP